MLNIDRKVNEGITPIFILLLGIENRNVGLSLDEEIINRYKPIFMIIIAYIMLWDCV